MKITVWIRPDERGTPTFRLDTKYVKPFKWFKFNRARKATAK